MKIKYYGNACFSIVDSDFTLVTDPHEKLSQAIKANAVIVSQNNKDHSQLDKVSNDGKVFNWPGEFELAGIHFQGIASFHNTKEDEVQEENTVFKVVMNGVSICHLGALGTKLTAEQLEQIGDVDILFVPVGGSGSMDAKKAKEVIEQIEPRIIIPMMYCDESDECGYGPLQPFLSEMGAQNNESMDEFTLKKSELPDDASKIVVLNSAN